MNPYIRAASKHAHIREQIAERASKRPEWAGKPQILEQIRERLEHRHSAPSKPATIDVEVIRRARDELGRFAPDLPETPEINEAWEPVPPTEPPKRGRDRG
jgi:hypothetical protein